MSDAKYYVVAFCLVMAVLFGSYGLALLGEPSSYWMWHEILGLAD